MGIKVTTGGDGDPLYRAKKKQCLLRSLVLFRLMVAFACAVVSISLAIHISHQISPTDLIGELRAKWKVWFCAYGVLSILMVLQTTWLFRMLASRTSHGLSVDPRRGRGSVRMLLLLCLFLAVVEAVAAVAAFLDSGEVRPDEPPVEAVIPESSNYPRYISLVAISCISIVIFLMEMVLIVCLVSYLGALRRLGYHDVADSDMIKKKKPLPSERDDGAERELFLRCPPQHPLAARQQQQDTPATLQYSTEVLHFSVDALSSFTPPPEPREPGEVPPSTFQAAPVAADEGDGPVRSTTTTTTPGLRSQDPDSASSSCSSRRASETGGSGGNGPVLVNNELYENPAALRPSSRLRRVPPPILPPPPPAPANPHTLTAQSQDAPPLGDQDRVDEDVGTASVESIPPPLPKSPPPRGQSPPASHWPAADQATDQSGPAAHDDKQPTDEPDSRPPADATPSPPRTPRFARLERLSSLRRPAPNPSPTAQSPPAVGGGSSSTPSSPRFPRYEGTRFEYYDKDIGTFLRPQIKDLDETF